MSVQLKKQGVKVRLDHQATVEEICALKPVGVVIACGAQPIIPDIPGLDGDNIYLAEEVVSGKVKPKGRVAVVGSGLTGLETAEILCQQGHQIVLVEMAREIGPGIFPAIRNDELSRLLPYNPAIYAGHRLMEANSQGVMVENLSTGDRRQLKADSVVLALGIRSRAELVEALALALPYGKIRLVGDARKGGRIADAIRDGFEAGYTF